MLESIASIGFGRNDYPITVAELENVSKELDAILDENERKELTDALAFHPEIGDPIAHTLNRLRVLQWRYGPKGGRQMIRIVYFFYDLNMPLYMVAVYKRGEAIRPRREERDQMLELTEVLIEEHAVRNLGRGTQHNVPA